MIPGPSVAITLHTVKKRFSRNPGWVGNPA